ncbi:MAG: ArsC/Spx/MgsR family protein [Acidimicrobiales bacterium]
MARPQLYFNRNCSTARKARDLLAAAGVEVEVVEYLKAPPDRATLRALVGAVDAPPAELVRKDKRFKELGLVADDYRSAGAVVDLLVEHPELLQRPILVVGERGVIGRPPERVLELVS